MRLHPGYAVVATMLFVIEVGIALFVRDSFVRPVLGDVLAVMLVYFAVLAIIDVRPAAAATFAFAVGVVVETLQYLDALTLVGLQQNAVARIVLGTTFSLGDIVAYAVGAVLALAGDTVSRSHSGSATRP